MPSWSEAYSMRDCRNDLISALLTQAPQRFEDHVKLWVANKGQPEFVNTVDLLDGYYERIYMVWLGTGTAFSFGPFIAAANSESDAVDYTCDYIYGKRAEEKGWFQDYDECIADGMSEQEIFETFFLAGDTGKLCYIEGTVAEALIDIQTKYVDGDKRILWERSKS